MLYRIKKILGIEDGSADEVLIILINKAKSDARVYCHTEDVHSIESTIMEMVVYRYSLLGSEGLGSESYNSVSFDYEVDYPPSILRVLNAHRKLRLV